MPPLLIAKTCNVQYIYSIKKAMRQQALAHVKQHTLCLKSHEAIFTNISYFRTDKIHVNNTLTTFYGFGRKIMTTVMRN